PELAAHAEAAGFHGVHDAAARGDAFAAHLCSVEHLEPETARAAVEAVTSLEDTRPRESAAWRHSDLLTSPYPRPYQYEAFSVFRGGSYRGLLVEAPTGSGKTMVGMLCIQDWLRTLRPGQSILVLVPTSNYQQQWIGELCFKRIGLRLPPEVVFSGTPAQLERFTRRTGSHPAIILTTYTALAQAGSGVGKGGFDQDSIETFLQAANIQYALLDEVHKVVEDMRSVSSDVVRLLVSWLQDDSLRGLIGFSGTAEAYRPRFQQLGLGLAHTIPLDTLVACGFVAPFAELGVPFANSARERRIRELLDGYKARLLELLQLVGGERIRGWFAEVPMEERVAIARDLLGMYRGRPDADQGIQKRLAGWEQGGDIGISELDLVTILQIARGWSDADLARRAEVSEEDLQDALGDLEAHREHLAELIYLPATVARLRRPGFGTVLAAEELAQLREQPGSTAARVTRAIEALATTGAGLSRGLNDWYLRTGEGRVETIKAVVDAEREVRRVSGVIVFDTGRRIRWRQGLTAPGYEGVGGLFAQMLGDERFTVLAALSGEMYLTLDEERPLAPAVAAFIERELMRGEVGGAVFTLATQGLDIEAPVLERLEQAFDELLRDYVAGLEGVRARRLGEFRRRVLRPFERQALKVVSGTAGNRLRSRLRAGNVHLDGLVTTFFDYALLARSFRNAAVAEIEQVSGARRRFSVVPMPGGRRKQLMYDLTARIVDEEGLGVNLVIVSNWARTGWNVIRPNLLIDATATRDVTAWQQLRGRAMRAPQTWTNDCYRALLALSEDAASADGATGRELVERVLGPDAPEALGKGLDALSEGDREALRVQVVLQRNKVTHIYELIKALGSARQLEYDRQARTWHRREAIERKHAYESSVDVFSGRLCPGAAHAPLLYSSDPRADLPEELRSHVGGVIRDADPRIVAGWQHAVARY
ncbi:MAG: DEAD/DEAH box helicase family protein, partial [Candidatus Dormibacteraeota bacterium]|nr:DEAD/DEAH box helicase family protein [Candidatus Dormibacteraeota bacterium]